MGSIERCALHRRRLDIEPMAVRGHAVRLGSRVAAHPTLTGDPVRPKWRVRMSAPLLFLIVSTSTAPPAQTPISTLAPPPASNKAPTEPLYEKWGGWIYGFVELDTIFDSTQSFADIAGNAAVQRPETYAGSHPRTTFSVRNSRFGFKLNAPEFEGIKASTTLEFDFMANLGPGASESAVFSSPELRARHLYLKLESAWVDVLLGQYWQVIGMQPAFFPNTVEPQAVPGELYSRAPQARLSHTFRGSEVSAEVAIAASRPPQRDSAVPDGQAGLRFMLNGWRGVHTKSATADAVDPLSIALSGVVRRFAVTEFAPMPIKQETATGWGWSVDALVPVVPASTDSRGNALTLTASFVKGAGIADLYPFLVGGVSNPPAFPDGTSAAGYTANIDNGLALYDKSGNLHPIEWRSFIGGLQYYFPPNGRFWIAAAYSWMSSNNAASFGAPTKVWNVGEWASGDLFWDATSAVRLGIAADWFRQTYADGEHARNWRGIFSAFYLF
jgi:hypothetical protein